MRQHLNEIKKFGYSFDDAEYVEGIYCIAAPIFNHFSKVVAAISITQPSFRFRQLNRDDLANEVRFTAEQISRRLGYSGVFPGKQ